MVTRIGPRDPIKHFLKEWRLKRDLTQQQLADRLPNGEDGKPTGKDQISRWERNQRGMTMDVQAALADALGLDNPGDLFRDPERPTLDELLRGATPEQRTQVISVVTALLRTG
jgi:transcriptional regulator with XRE-family HTH domain